MNKFQIKSNWNEIKDKLKQKYAELTEEDLSFTEGREEDMLGRLAQRLGRSKEHLRQEIEEVQQGFTVVRDMAEDAVQSGERYMRANPLPVVLGALLLGAALGALLTPRRKQPDPVQAVREWLEKTLEDFSKQWPKVKKQAYALQDDLVGEAKNLRKKVRLWYR
jgi:uncharacterized protein YjbJ (UPF0337 family)